MLHVFRRLQQLAVFSWNQNGSVKGTPLVFWGCTYSVQILLQNRLSEDETALEIYFQCSGIKFRGLCPMQFTLDHNRQPEWSRYLFLFVCLLHNSFWKTFQDNLQSQRVSREHAAEAQDAFPPVEKLCHACCGPLVLDANLPFLSFDFVFSLPLSPVGMHYGFMLPFRHRISLHSLHNWHTWKLFAIK